MRRVMIVEDEFLIRLTLAEALADEGFEPIEAATGDEAFAKLQTAPMDLILTDINMPGTLNGWSLADAARARQPSIPIVFMSGFAQPPPGRTPSPHDAFMAKPYLPSDLIALVQRLLGD